MRTGNRRPVAVLDAIGPYLHRLDPVHRQALTRDLPCLSRLFDGLPAPSPEPSGDAGPDRAQHLRPAGPDPGHVPVGRARLLCTLVPSNY